MTDPTGMVRKAAMLGAITELPLSEPPVANSSVLDNTNIISLLV
jgi:hypothetical protein